MPFYRDSRFNVTYVDPSISVVTITDPQTGVTKPSPEMIEQGKVISIKTFTPYKYTVNPETGKEEAHSIMFDPTTKAWMDDAVARWNLLLEGDWMSALFGSEWKLGLALVLIVLILFVIVFLAYVFRPYVELLS